MSKPQAKYLFSMWEFSNIAVHFQVANKLKFQDKKAHESSVADGKAAHNVSTGTEEHCMETFHEWGEFEEELAASKPYGEYLRNKAELSYNDGNDGNDGLVFKTDIFSEQRLG